ncbi:MAG TPA: VIT domain-containing protein [Pyrinomonadaceae bacterium]|nr:VIT domain-containing protein [Pyrinomonadaceae bacterium]
MRKIIFPVVLCLFLALGVQAQKVTQGELEAVTADGKPAGLVPLKHTNVKAEISGFLSRVRVTQEFENNFSEKIEAVYVFPLPQSAAVDDMTMRIGERVVRGRVMKREEAREVYEAAKSNGQIASLLDQERPNIFTQSVANILPGEKIIIEISYVETLKYEDGFYEFVFPMVVGPRYIPGNPTGKQGGGFAPDTDRVPDASKITPMPAKERAGHDISIEVKLDAGVPLQSVVSKTHEIESLMLSASSYGVKLKNEKTIPNKDFILRYDVSGKKIEDAVLTHRGEKGGYFTLILQPPDEPRAQDVTPKEIVFVLDTSGSMSGFPIEKAKEAMRLALDGLHPQDTFNLITFAGDTHILFEKPVAATAENLRKAQAFLASRSGSGGTEMMKAIKAALEPTNSQQHIRVVCFMTDGYVGNDMEIIGEIQRHPNARVFSFGIGSSVNRFLLDKMAEEGRGEVEYVALNDDGSAAAHRFHERVRSPLLTDISFDFGNLQAADVYPKRINDLFSAKPVVIYGRFTQPGNGVIKLKGKSFGREIVREIPVNFPASEPNHDVLATLWARTRIDDLMSFDWNGIQNGNAKTEIKDTITNLGIEYRLMTQFTSFVAVEERIVTDGGQPRRIEVPVEMPDGVSREGVFGDESGVLAKGKSFTSTLRTAAKTRPEPISGTHQVNAIAAEVTVTSESRMIDTTDSSVTTKIKPENFGYGSGIGSGSGSGRGSGDSRKRADNSFVIDGQETTNFRTGEVRENSSATLSGKAVELPKPILSPNKTWDGSDGLVNVRVTIDESGRVVSAAAESGHQALRVASEQAARSSKFKINQPEGKANQITGLIVYNFVLEKKKPQVEIGFRDFVVKLSPEEQKRRKIAAKVSTAVFNLIERLRNNQTQAAPDEAKFVQNGKADVIIRLKELKPETIQELKKHGFEVLTEIPSAKAVVGRIVIEKIVSLAELEAVTFISPQNR